MTVQFLEQASYLSSLRKRWAAFSLSGALLLGCAYAWLHASWGAVEALSWLLCSTPVFLYLSFSLWRGLPYNYRAGEAHLLPTLGTGNHLTLLRGLLVAMLAGFLFAPRPTGFLAWLPGLLMTAIATADLFDGYLARRADHATRLGEILDMQLDGLSLLLSASLVVLYRQAPAWFLLVGLSRYLFLAGITLRNRLGQPVFDLAPSAVRRPFAGALMGFTTVLLYPLFTPPATHLAAALFALPFLAGFTRDWLVVSGVISLEWDKQDIPPKKAPFRHLQGLSLPLLNRRDFLRWLPVGLRAILVAGLAVELAHQLSAYFSHTEGITGRGSLPIIGLFFVAAVLMAAGAAGRVGAVCALFAFGLQARSTTLDGMDLALIVVSTALFFLGTGAASAWTPEDRLIEKRLGEGRGLEA
jgi:CDP-diacylglycerol---glycerol-3-phosphate 3-phosphatidyltransferase